jgi:sulfhydrogenase subunit beta (sulfur reductase)
MPVVSKIEIRNASITHDNLLKLLGRLCEEKTLLAPVRDEQLEDVNFLPVTDAAQICFDYDNTTTSPKEFFFPESECMFSFSSADNDTIKLNNQAEEAVLFGIRSCDMKAIELLDKFYERKFEDSFYLSKRKKTVIISVGCSELNEQCFCTSTKTGPVLEEGFDLQLLKSGDDYIVQVGSEKGLELFESYAGLFGPATDADAKKIIDGVKKSEPKFDLQTVYQKLKDDKVSDTLWEDIAGRCQSCGLCLFLCPTCSCYTVLDKAMPAGENRRLRQWDACYFRGFTRMAGLNDAVRDNKEMVRRKYNHKLMQQIDEFGMSGCTGCGRCNLTCVGNVNWLENIIKIEKGA